MSEPTAHLTTTTADPDLEAGQQVGEYVVEARIGEGAFGTVFRAVHPLIGKVVAIKVLARKFSVDPEIVSRFQAEARAVNQIRHRNIIDIFSFGTLDDGRHYYVMEHLDGETLDARVTRETRLSLAEALPILRGIGRALDAAHAKGIAHRDLKAENVFLAADSDGGGVFPKLLDFGIAKLMAPEDGLKHKTRTGTPVGTPYYMSPEQCRGRDVDHRTDLYAFGVLAYLLLTGKYPHDADDYMSILMRQLTEHPDPPSSVVPDLPAGIDDAIGWLIAKDPADRPPSLKVAVGAFEAAAEAAGIAVGTDGWDMHTPPPGLATQPPNVGAARISGMPAKAPSNPWRKSVKPAAPAPKKSRGPLYAAIAGVVVVAAVVVVLRLQPWESSESSPAPVAAEKPVPVKVNIDPPAKPAPTPIPEAQTVIVTVTGVPEGTEVLVGGMTVGAAPGPVQLPRDAAQQVVMVFKADGYKLESRTVLPDKDQNLAITLKKKAITAPTKKPTKDDIIEVFKK